MAAPTGNARASCHSDDLLSEALGHDGEAKVRASLRACIEEIARLAAGNGGEVALEEIKGAVMTAFVEKIDLVTTEEETGSPLATDHAAASLFAAFPAIVSATSLPSTAAPGHDGAGGAGADGGAVGDGGEEGRSSDSGGEGVATGSAAHRIVRA